MKQEPDKELQIRISKNDLLMAAKGIVSTDQVQRLWDTLHNTVMNASKVSQFMYYFGAFVAISSMTCFLTLGWNRFDGRDVALIALCYGMIFFASGYFLWQRKGVRVPGGLLVTAAIFMIPLAIFGLEKCTGIWPSADLMYTVDYFVWVNRSWLFMEIGTTLIGLVALRFVKFPLMTMPIALSLWLMSTDWPLLFGKLQPSLKQGCYGSLVFGLVLLAGSLFAERRSWRDFAFWGYFFGTLAFWGGLSLLVWDSEFNWWFYLLINIAMAVSSIFLERNVLMIFGTIGIFYFLSHLASVTFRNSLYFPFVLSFIGIMIVGLGFLFQRKHLLIKAFFIDLFAKRLR